MDGIFSLDAARDIQVKHGRLLRVLDRIWSILPRAMAEKFMRPATRPDLKGRERRGYALLPRGIPFLFMGQATRAQILWVAGRMHSLGAEGQELAGQTQAQFRDMSNQVQRGAQDFVRGEQANAGRSAGAGGQASWNEHSMGDVGTKKNQSTDTIG